MYYEINVLKNGQHFFATAERSITDRDKLDAVYKALKAAFPESEGYLLHVSRYERVCRYLAEGISGELIPISQQDD